MKKIVEHRLVSSPNKYFDKELKERIEYMKSEGYEVEARYSTSHLITILYTQP